MKRKYQIRTREKTIEREYSYIPLRYIVAILITLFEIASIIAIIVALCMYVPYFYILCYVTAAACVIKIVGSDDNPDYKAPWVLFVITVPIIGFMLYFLFYSRKLQRKFVRRLDELERYRYEMNDEQAFEE